MIIDARALQPGDALAADICIVGGGAAGITLADALRGSGLSVLLLESAGTKPEHGDPFGGEVGDPKHPPLELYRVRGLGGTTSLWGGRCVPYDPIDFEARDWIPHSGWPIPHDAVARHYPRALEYCDAAGAFDVADCMPGRQGEIAPGLDCADVDSGVVERFSHPTDFGRRYRARLAAAGNVRVILNAHCVHIGLNRAGSAVERLVIAPTPTTRLLVRASTYVLAAGALETTRLLLDSDDIHGAGIGNDRGHLGRFYMCHVEGKAGVVRFRPDLPVVWRYERDDAGVYCKRRIWITAAAQRRHGLANMIMRFEPPPIADAASHRSGILSAMFLSRTFLKTEYARKLASFGYRGQGNLAPALPHLANLLRDFPTLFHFTLDWTLRHTLARRKLPYVMLPNRTNAFFLDFNAEQVPNPDSRVELLAERDRYGMRRLRVDWRTTGFDTDSVLRGYRLLKDRIEGSELGRLDFAEEDIALHYNAIGGHHIGTARMAADPARGVVDRDCRVFGVANLYLASCAVFPTSSHANPTLTIVALALRLADHLRARHGLATGLGDPVLQEF